MAGIEIFGVVNDLLGGVSHAVETPNTAGILNDHINYSAEEKYDQNQGSSLEELLEKNSAEIAGDILIDVGQTSMGIGESEAGEVAYEWLRSKEKSKKEVEGALPYSKNKKKK